MPVRIETPCSFKELTVKWHGEMALKAILWEDERSNNFKMLLKSSSPIKHFMGIVGPEGGFTREEIEAAGEAGFESASMGDRVLRAETAAITMVAIAQYELGDLCL